jgi:hypothetical protein
MGRNQYWNRARLCFGSQSMTAQDWAGLAVALITIIGAFATAVRWLVKHYLNELKPNGGSSVKDSVARLERQVEEIYRILLTRSDS